MLLCCSSAALAGDIYRYRSADGRILFSDNPVAPANTVESTRLDNGGNRLLTVAPGDPADRDGAQSEVRTAEAALMRAYNQLTANVLPRQDEILQVSATDPVPAIRGRSAKLPKTPQYYERIGALKDDIQRAQDRLDAARTRFHAMK